MVTGCRMDNETDLARRAVDSDFFGADAFALADDVTAPPKYELVRCLGHGGAGVVWFEREQGEGGA